MDYTYYNKWATMVLCVKNENHNKEKLKEEVFRWGGNSSVIDGKFLSDRVPREGRQLPGQMLKNGIYESSFEFFEEAEKRNDCPELMDLKSWFIKSIQHVFYDYFAEGSHYVEDYKQLFKDKKILKEDIVVDIAESWLHLTGNGGSHGAHGHPGFSWAMVYYIDIADSTETNGNNIFYDYNKQHQDGRSEFGNFYKDGGTLFTLTPEDGLLMLFPADIIHSANVYRSQNNNTRIVIACNCHVHCEKWWSN